jgi:hypothetical protein
MHSKSRIFRFSLVLMIILLIPLLVVPTYSIQGEVSLAGTAMLSSEMNTLRVLSFEEDEENVFANPERGWYKSFFSDHLVGLQKLRAQGISIIMIKVNLKDYTESSIDEKKLTEISRAFDKARYYGLQVIFRAAYDFEGTPSCEPQDIERILHHIDQLSEIFIRHSDVLYTVQAGFLGPWGEWHSSVFGDPLPVETRRAVLFALMEAVPSNISIQVRRPMFIRDIFSQEKTGHVLDEATAFGTSYLARTGYHNDAFLSTYNDSGTYVDPNYSREDELSWIENHAQYTPVIAETSQLGEQSEPENAIYEMRKQNAHALNLDYHPEVISSWKSADYEGINTFDYISRNLGYRFVLHQASVNTTLVKGGVVQIILNLSNEGFGTLIKERAIYIVLSDGKREYRARINEDPRRWNQKTGVFELELYFCVPSSMPSGSWGMYIHMPDPAKGLFDDPRYAIRFANQGIWDPKTGLNQIFEWLRIEEPISNNAGEVAEFLQITKAEANELKAQQQDHGVAELDSQEEPNTFSTKTFAIRGSN